ncbi:MAG: Nicotinate-nucleotide adenylyltransferase [bacterium ADurb.Bin236]|nr:MAG: Nicotinate-nucleotide adenylyltransferase [bacterium ADurb.Bin236]HOY63636.1 nicotinate-nucleotide adenylyltransferase [bacterium]
MNKKKSAPGAPKLAPSRKSKARKTFRVGVMGGTFNPIHYGHLLAAEQARCKFKLDRVIFVPTGDPPHKDSDAVAPSEHRYLMTVLATSTNPYFRVSRVEIDRKGPSYSIDTINHFLEKYTTLNPSIYFISGLDAVMEIMTWSRAPEILEKCVVIAATRPGYDTERARECLGERVFRKIKILKASALAISSTDIRERTAAGQPIKYLLPESVEQYILNHGIYGEAAKRG